MDIIAAASQDTKSWTARPYDYIQWLYVGSQRERHTDRGLQYAPTVWKKWKYSETWVKRATLGYLRSETIIQDMKPGFWNDYRDYWKAALKPSRKDLTQGETQNI